MSSGLPHVKSGKIVALGVTEGRRSPAAPDIPALSETRGFEKVDINVWFGLYGPAGLPDDVATVLRTALDEVLGQDDLRERQIGRAACRGRVGQDVKIQVVGVK